jgi:hypothetical protein
MSYEQLKADVEGNGNVLTVTMERLRDALGHDRLGANVCRDISNRLAGLDLGHVPIKLPQSKDKQVRVYTLGTDVAEMIRAAFYPGPENDAKLKGFAEKKHV